MGFPGGASCSTGYMPMTETKRPRFDPWVGKIPWRWARQLTPVFLLGKSHGQRRWAKVHRVGKGQTQLQ